MMSSTRLHRTSPKMVKPRPPTVVGAGGDASNGLRENGSVTALAMAVNPGPKLVMRNPKKTKTKTRLGMSWKLKRGRSFPMKSWAGFF